MKGPTIAGPDASGRMALGALKSLPFRGEAPATESIREAKRFNPTNHLRPPGGGAFPLPSKIRAKCQNIRAEIELGERRNNRKGRALKAIGGQAQPSGAGVLGDACACCKIFSRFPTVGLRATCPTGATASAPVALPLIWR